MSTEAVAECPRPPGMAPVAGGAFTMGSDDFYAEERPARRTAVAAFLIDLHPVTNGQFARFVSATGHVTTAEREGSSLVFVAPARPVNLRGPPVWWSVVMDASWRRPEGPGSAIDLRTDHPVVHVSHADARAYAEWAGLRLPGEAEWECAARGGLDGAPYAWGDTLLLDGRRMANTWQGDFPHRPLGPGRRPGTSAVGAFPPNGFGLYDMIGNVWEWTVDSADLAATDSDVAPCCAAAAPSGFVLKGGSYLCAPDYCRRYRPAARLIEPASHTACHIGFRCARDM